MRCRLCEEIAQTTGAAVAFADAAEIVRSRASSAFLARNDDGAAVLRDAADALEQRHRDQTAYLSALKARNTHSCGEALPR